VFDDATLFCLDDGIALTAQSFQVPPMPTLQLPSEPSMSTTRTLANIFFAPSRAFASFRDVTTFTSTAVRFLIAAAIIVLATLAYKVIYPARVGSENIAQASIEVSPRLAGIPSEQKERALQMRRNPAFQIVGNLIRFGLMVAWLVASLPLGALIYWLGARLFKGTIAYLQALLVWTYAALPPTVVWMVANTIALFIWPPSTNMAIVRGPNGVIHANLGALFTVTTLPIPDHVVLRTNARGDRTQASSPLDLAKIDWDRYSCLVNWRALSRSHRRINRRIGEVMNSLVVTMPGANSTNLSRNLVTARCVRTFANRKQFHPSVSQWETNHERS